MTDLSRPVRTPRTELRRSVPFWLLLAGSVASFGYGGWLVLDKITTMTATIADGSATGIEVYAGQAWVVVGGAFLAAGLIGLVTVLSLAVIRSILPIAAAAPAAESVDATSEDETPADADQALGYDPQLGYAEPATEDASPAAAEADELPETVSIGR
jgi:hypothetical protein